MNEYCIWDHDSRQVLDDNVFIVPSLPRTLRINFTRLHTTIQDSFISHWSTFGKSQFIAKVNTNSELVHVVGGHELD